jgi:hypothetical protein
MSDVRLALSNIPNPILDTEGTKVQNQVKKLDSFVHLDVLLTVCECQVELERNLFKTIHSYVIRFQGYIVVIVQSRSFT